ncbi:WxL domain-containing protein [Lacticaseibacillus paracasei]|uniref:WxL domain-containing protein n=1 Tax=Lacticaseibacillus paracasei TaxID=1597 RepID=UPI0021A9CC8F|nr:WxL domain-containing protein [Lacticaseibacillus paracasei]MCT4393702.1 cell surface complex protein [Lacticaseibacillus paracasei]
MSGLMLLQPLVSSASTQLAKSLMPSESSTSATDSLVSGAESILDSSKTSQPSTSQQKTTQASASSAKASASVEKPTQAKESSASSSKEAAASASVAVSAAKPEPPTAARSKRSIEDSRLRSGAVPVFDQDHPCPVKTTAELKEAIEKGIPYVRLTADINIGREAIPVKNSVTIDGDHKYTYMYNSGESWHRGIYFNASNISITFKNLKIGDRNVAESANNYYGIAPADNHTENSKIIVENVDYYSDRGAQPFHIRKPSNQIVFKGKNTFYTMKKGALVQEFAEATNYLFEEDSDTTIEMADNPLLGTFWASAGSLNLELKKRARLKVVSSNALVYTDGLAHHNNRITIGEDAVLDAYLTDKNDGAFMYHHDDLVVDVQKNGQLLIQTTKATPFTKASSINLGPGAKADLKNLRGDFFHSGDGTIKIDNADELSFGSGDHGTKSPTGLTAGKSANLIFAPFSAETKGYDIYADNQLLETQSDDSDWQLNGKKVERTPTKLDKSAANRIQKSTALRFTRNGSPFKATSPDVKPPDQPKPDEKDKQSGALKLVEVPDFDFGTLLISGETQVVRPQIRGKLSIEDSRKIAKKQSRLSMKVIQPFKNGEIDVTGNMSYISQTGQEQVLSDQSILVEETADVDQRDVSSEWNQTIDSSARGFKLTIPVEKQKLGTFSGKVEWSLQDVPAN